jgi:deoxyribodipyrimidine photo-lyase
MSNSTALVWFRRDLRDYDHAALSAAFANAQQVYCVFIFDTEILDALPSKHDRRVHFIHESLLQLDNALRARGGNLIVRHGRSTDEIPMLACQIRPFLIKMNYLHKPASHSRYSHLIKMPGSSG